MFAHAFFPAAYFAPIYWPPAGTTPPPAAVRYEGRRPEPEDEEELSIVLALFQALVRGDDRTP